MRFFILGTLLGCLSLLLPAQQLSHSQVLRDAHALERIIYKVHPAPYAYISKDSIQERFRAMTAFEGDSLSAKEWEIRVRHLLISMGCGHTYVAGKKRKKLPPTNRFALPFQIFSDSTRAWISGMADSVQKAGIPIGAELVALDNQPIEKVLEKLHHHQSTDGYNQTFGRQLLNKKLLFNYLYIKYMAHDSLHIVTWKDKTGLINVDTIAGARDKDLYSDNAERDTILKILYHTGKGDQYFYYHPQQPEIGVLNIKAFHGKGSKLYRQAVKDLKKTHAKYLVIDMRDNTGGSFASSVNLIRHVANKSFQLRLHRRLFRSWHDQSLLNHLNRFSSFLMFDVFNPNLRWIKHGNVVYCLKYRPYCRRLHFDGQVFLLTNGLSFSASSQTATYIRAVSNAVIIGDETGGGAFANNGMQIPLFKLPASGLRIRVPQYHLDYRLGHDTGRGVMPDVHIQYQIDDILRGRDLEWEATLQWITQHPERQDLTK
jgi:hypothetical protein